MIRARSALLGVLLLPLAARAAPPETFAEWLPADTIAFLETAPMTVEERARAVAYKAMDEPELKQVLDRMLAQSTNFSNVAVPMGQSMLRASLDMRESGIAFEITLDQGGKRRQLRVRGNLALAWVGLDRRVGSGELVPDVAASLGVVNDPKEALELVREAMLALAREAPDAPHGKRSDEISRAWEHKDVPCTSVLISGSAIHFAAIGDRIVLTTRRARLVDVIDRSAPSDRMTPSLAASPMYRDTVKRALGSGTITTLVQVNALAAMKEFAAEGGPKLQQVPGLIGMFGLGGFEGLTSVSRVDADGVAGTTSVLVRGPRVGLSRLFEEQPPAKYSCLAFVPKDCLYVSAGRFDLKGTMKALGESFQMYVMGLAMTAQKEVGVDIIRDLLDHIGPESAFIVSLNSGVIPDVGIVFESDDPASMQATLVKLLQAAPWPRGTGLEKTRIGGVDAYVIKLGHEDLLDFPLAPTFGVVDGHFVAAAYPISFQRFVATKRSERPSILANPEFVEMRKRVPEDAISMSYLDVRRAVGMAYDSLLPILQSMPQQDGALPLYEFPEASIFTKHLYGRVAWRVADERGMHWHSHSSTDVGAIALGLGAAGVSLLFLGVRETDRAVDVAAPVRPIHRLKGDPPQRAVGSDERRDMEEVDACTDNLRYIRGAFRRLRARNRALPKSLDDLPGRMIDADTLIVPGTDSKRYRYFGPDGKNGVLVAGAPNGPGKKVSVLTTDDRIVRVTPDQLRQMLGD